MAQAGAQPRSQNLRIDTTGEGLTPEDGPRKEYGQDGAARALPVAQEIEHDDPSVPRSTRPISIADDGRVPEDAISPTDGTNVSSLEHYIHNRKTSISFDKEVRLDSGERHSMAIPLHKSVKDRPRGRSLLQEMAEEKRKKDRAHSESDKTHYDPLTGQELPKYQKQRMDMIWNRGESRHPLLQTTSDALAGEAMGDHPVSLTSASTLSPPTEDASTPPQSPKRIQSPRTQSPRAFSYEDTSSPWSHMKSARRQTSGRRASRQSTNSGKSPASSFLRAFSYSSRGSNDGDYDRPPSPDSEGQTIGEDYVLGKQIGYGGFSVIKEVFQGTGRRLAVKIVRRNIANKDEAENESAQTEFEHEVEIWRFLRHNHVLPLEAVYKTDFATFCFIPLNIGGTLFDVVRANRQGLAPRTAMDYAAQLASALRYLHEDAHVTHRDVKLENCLLDTSVEPHNVRLCDFGMSEWLSSDNDTYASPSSPGHSGIPDRPPSRAMGPSESSTSAFAGGSLEYAAPEILRASETPAGPDGFTVDPAVDIWAFGVCVYALVCGSRPFQSSFQPRIAISILRGEWDQERLCDKGGDDVSELVRGCLALKAYERWDIRDIISSAWLRDECEKEMEDGVSGRWKF